MDLMVIHENEWSFQVNFERPGERCCVQTAEWATIIPGAFGGPSAAEGLGDSSACAGVWKGITQWMQGELEGWLHREAGCAPVGSSPHPKMNRLFWGCTALTGTSFSLSELCMMVVPKPSWLSVLTALCCKLWDWNGAFILDLLFLPVWNCNLSTCSALLFQKGTIGVVSSWPNWSDSLDPCNQKKKKQGDFSLTQSL